MSQYQMPACLNDLVDNEANFKRWLDRKARAHVNRDRKRQNNCDKKPSIRDYKQRIIEAIKESQGRDFYTGEKLAWDKISTWDNDAAKDKRAEYRREFWDLPSVDHDGDKFRICSWRMNDSKSDQTIDEFLKLADRVRKHRAL
ncbi:MAG: hypothetical protein KIT44_09010 [Opitutaceae bacterium]|nr:hypothetical protein [Opitutaceae bacterium]